MNGVKLNQKNFGRQAPAFGFLANISMGWKMTLMAFVLFLGILGVTLSAYTGLQSLRYQLSNIYDFMLVPIVTINNADATLADVQYAISQSHREDLSMAERAQYVDNIEPGNQSAEAVITRYGTEWVTTVSPEFTQALRDGGKIALQEQEVEALADLHTAYDAYLVSLDKYLATVRSGKPSPILAEETIENLIVARAHLQELIAVNNQYAAFSNELALGAFRQALVTGGIVLVVVAILGLVMSYLIATSITGRLGDLTRSAALIQEGNLDQPAVVAGRDELGLLGDTFNSMARQLKEIFSTLEQRVADRTRALSSVAEVSTAASTILETDKLLQQVVDLSKDRFNLYHSHIYLLNEAGDTLVLTSGAGEPGRKMVAEGRSIPLDREQSLVARAAREKKGVTVNDVTQAPDFLPNPLLPDTRSELAVPMMVGEQVIGVFDVQSDVVGRFTDADIAVQTTLASQVASAVQNARLYTQAELTRQEAQTLVDYATEGIAILDLETELWAEPNENFARVFGMTREEMVTTGPKVMSPSTQPDGRDSVEKAIEMINTAMEKGFHRFEWVHTTKQGTEFDCEIGLVRMPGDRPRLRQSILDITERKRLENLTALRARQQEAINLITQKIQAASTIEEAMQVAARELGHALGRRQTLVALEPSALGGDGKTTVNE